MYFKDEYDFLSNFYPCPVVYQGIIFHCSEAAYQSSKCPERREDFRFLNGAESKKLGKKVNY